MNLRKYPESYLFITTILYLILIWVIHLAIVSVVNFFHFQLSHNLSIIEKWMSYNAWEVILLSKLLALLVFIKYFSIHLDDRRPFRKIFRGGLRSPDHIFFAIILLIYSVVFYFSFKGVPQEKLNQYHVSFFSYISLFSFYLIDLAFIYLMTNHLKIKGIGISALRLIFAQIILSLMIIFFSNKTFLYVEHFYPVFIFNFVISLRFMTYKKLNWSLPLLYLLSCGVPLIIFLQMDPVSLELASAKGLDASLSTFIVLVFLVNAYIHFRNKKLID